MSSGGTGTGRNRNGKETTRPARRIVKSRRRSVARLPREPRTERLRAMRKLVLAVLGLTAAFALTAQSAVVSSPPRPLPGIEHVVIIIVDGLRPDVLLLANAPALHAMVHSGSYTFWARTTDVAITLPSCTSMLTGVKPAKHGVNWNGALPADRQLYPAGPTV